MDPKTRLDDKEKRNIPPVIQKILEKDVQLTKQFVCFLLNFMPVKSLQRHCKFLEVSCHGILWLVGWLAFCWMFLDSPHYSQMQVNMFIGLILDIIFVAIIKAATRRRRPTVNDDPFEIGPDKFSFPSGHASRSVYILCFFTMLHPLTYFVWPAMFAWAISVCFSRLLMYRHHILDVCAGVVLGILEAVLLGILWCGQDTSTSLMAWISDDKVAGTDNY